MTNDISTIRNFSIIAHIDHGKSTLADRILECTHAISQRDMREQYMDTMELERERGITIKLNNASVKYRSQAGKDYRFNLIDTPGHVDFSYEVSRSLAACEGVLLVVDASQGVEAQTLANAYLAIENDLVLIPVINKIDMPAADPERVKNELLETLGLDPEDAIYASAKEGIGITDIMEAIVSRIPPPQDNKTPLQALIFDSYFDTYRGVVVLIRIKEGSISVGDKILMMGSDKSFEVLEVGKKTPEMTPVKTLQTGEVGYVIANVKNIGDALVGDTITWYDNPASTSLPGYRKVTPMVYCGLYPIDGNDYEDLKEALNKLQLNDSALFFEPETSQALGFGFRCGFLGLLHMEIVQERISREFSLSIIATAPNVIVKIHKSNGEVLEIDNPAKLPDLSVVDYFEEPIANASIMVPQKYTGAVMDLCQVKRGTMVDMEYIDETRVVLKYALPLIEIVMDFFNKLKSVSQGYASLDYEIDSYKRSKMVKLDIMLNGNIVDALSSIVHKDMAYGRGRALTEKLKETIPRHMFEIPIQAAIGSKVIARETIRAMRKDVTAKCYGGDISRKRKLLEKQKEGKKKMKSIGNVELPQEAFLSILKLDD